MTGRRLLDAAALFKVSRGVASKYVALRNNQFDAYTKTSSIAKAVKSQTDRVTLTVRAASALAERFNGPTPQYSTKASQSRPPEQDVSIQTRESVEGAVEGAKHNTSFAQDHFYERSEDHTTAEPPPGGNLQVRQEKAKSHPLPDGSIPFTEATNNGSAEKTKKLQRQAETRIPSQAAEPPPAVSSDAEAPELTVDQEQDIFYTPSPSSGPVLSALPRFKLPKNTENAQEGDEHVPDAQINQDVFYSATPKAQEDAVPRVEAVTSQEQLLEETYTEIFHSPRVAQMLSSHPQQGSSTKGLELPGAGDTPVKKTRPSQETGQLSSSVRTPVESVLNEASSALRGNKEPSSPRRNDNGDLHKLASDMAKDADAAIDPSRVSSVRNMSTGLMLIH